MVAIVTGLPRGEHEVEILATMMLRRLGSLGEELVQFAVHQPAARMGRDSRCHDWSAQWPEHLF